MRIAGWTWRARRHPRHPAAFSTRWPLEGDELYLLQARPITGLPRQPQIDAPPGRGTKDAIHWSGPMRPAGASVLLPVLEGAFATFLAEFGFPLEAIRFRSFGGEVYAQETRARRQAQPGRAHGRRA